MTRERSGGRSVALIPLALVAVLLAVFVWMLATDRVWPSNSVGPDDDTIPATPPPGAPTLPVQNEIPRSATYDLVYV